MRRILLKNCIMILEIPDSILNAEYPKLENKYLVESEKEYPVSINGKLRTTITISLDASKAEVKKWFWITNSSKMD